LRLAASAFDLPALFVEQLLRLVAVTLGAVDRVLQCLLSLLDRFKNGGERLPAEQKVQNAEDDQRPEHQIDPQLDERRILLRLLREKRRAVADHDGER
jgi:hypothetical protein